MNIDFVAAEKQIKADGNFIVNCRGSWGILGDGSFIVEQAPSVEDAIIEYFEGNLDIFLAQPE